MAGYVFDHTPAPPLLEQAWAITRYGVNALDLPPGMFAGFTQALGAYQALHGYKTATGATVRWTTEHPEAWRFVSSVIAWRKTQQENP